MVTVWPTGIEPAEQLLRRGRARARSSVARVRCRPFVREERCPTRQVPGAHAPATDGVAADNSGRPVGAALVDLQRRCSGSARRP